MFVGSRGCCGRLCRHGNGIFSLGFQFKSSLLSQDCQLYSTNMGKYKGKIKGKGKGLAAIGTDKEH
jgi:hypothetical protein